MSSKTDVELDALFAGITRLEVIDDHGRRYARRNLQVAPSLQDNGRTLKLFVSERETKADD